MEIFLFAVASLVVSILGQECTVAESKTEFSSGKSVVIDHGQTFDVGQFLLLNNIWGLSNNYSVFEETIFLCAPGAPHSPVAYGFTWNRTSSRTHLPTYPESLFGASPFTNQASTSPLLPLKLSAVKSIVATMDIAHVIEDGNGKNYWDFAYDIWFSTAKPGTGVSVARNITDEIMIWFGWNADSDPTPVEARAVNDSYAVYDYANFQIMQGQWRYHQFRITGGQRIPEHVSLKPFFDYVQQRYKIPDEWLCSIELGTETGDGTVGTAIFYNLAYTFETNN